MDSQCPTPLIELFKKKDGSMKVKKTIFQLMVRLDVLTEAVCGKEQKTQIKQADQLELPLDMEPDQAAKEFKEYFAGERKLPRWMNNQRN